MFARNPRRSCKPLLAREAPECGPIVRVVRGKAIAKPVDPEAEARGMEAIERLMADPRRAARRE